MGFIKVQWAKDEMEASITKGFLESIGIESVISPLNTNEVIDNYQATSQKAPYGVFVKSEQAEEAKKVLEERDK